MRSILCIFLILAIVLINSCMESNEEQSLDAKIKKIESETGLAFPANSAIIHFSEPDVLVDPVWVAKVIIPTKSYESLKEAVIAKTDDKTIYSGALADSTDWWKPKNVILTKQYLANQNTFVNIIVSKEGGDFAVYIECAVF